MLRSPLLLSILGLFAGLSCVQAQTAASNDEAARVVEDASKIKVEQRQSDKLPTLWIIGDSTVRVNTKAQRGWGDEIAGFLDTTKINVVNRAIGGRSSRTFLTDGRWDKILEEIQPGDIVLMQFGHNDGGPLNEKVLDKSTRARGTIKGIGEETEEVDNILTKKHEVVHSYGWYMRKYVTDAQKHKAIPVVCSLVPRKIWNEDGKTVRVTVGSYRLWAQQVAEQTGALYIDLHGIIAKRWEEIGPAAVEPLFSDPHTHSSPEGAKFNAGCVIEGLKALPNNPLKDYLK